MGKTILIGAGLLGAIMHILLLPVGASETPTHGSKKKTQHTILFLVSLPRSMSTAVLRAIHARGDFMVVHEPGVATLVYLQGRSIIVEKAYEGIVEAITTWSYDNNVFVKEMGFAAKNYLLHPALLSNPKVFFVFLIRNPHDALVSFFKKTSSPSCIEEMSYEDLWHLFQQLDAMATNKPIVITAEAFSSQPRDLMQKICAYAGIPFIEKSLQWKDMSNNLGTEEEWFMTPHCYFSRHWHLNALQSTGFHHLTTYAVDTHGEPTLEEIENVEYRNTCKEILATQMPYYKRMLYHALYF